MAQSNEPARQTRAGDQERDATLRILQEAHGVGRLDHEELANRQELALTAKYIDELHGLVQDLPEAQRVAPPLSPSPAAAHYLAVSRQPGWEFAVMSGKAVRVRPGTRLYRAVAWWGGNDVDVTDAMGPGVVLELKLVTCMGGFKVRVPEGVKVVDEATYIMAGSDTSACSDGDGSNGVLVLRGFNLWGGSDFKLTKPEQV